MLDRTSRHNGLPLRGITRSALLLSVVAIAVVVLLPSAFAQSFSKPAPGGPAGASASTPHVTGATVAQNRTSLTLPSPGALNVFGMANGGEAKTTGFTSGNVVTATDKRGYVSAAIGVTQLDSNSYATKDHYDSIGGVGVSGFNFYGERTAVLVPPVQPTSTLSYQLVLPESALIVVVALSGGQTSLGLKGVPGISIVANGTGGTWSGIVFGEAQLKAGTYSVKETTTNHDAGGTNRADAFGVFAFSNSRAGFISEQIATRLVATCAVGSAPGLPGYDPANHYVYVPNSASGTLTVLSQTCHLVGTITLPAGASPNAAAYDPVNQLMYVTNGGGGGYPEGSVYVIQGLHVEHTIGGGKPYGQNVVYPYGLVWDPNASVMLVANAGYGISGALTGWVDAIQGTEVVSQIWTAPDTEGICYDPFSDTIISLSTAWYLSDIINATSLEWLGEPYVGNISGPGSGPLSCAYDPEDHYVYVSISSGNLVLLLDGNNGTTFGNVSVGSTDGYPNAESDIAWDPAGQTIWVAVDGTNGNESLGIISGLSVVESVSVANVPYGLAYDSLNRSMYVTTADTSPGTVYVVS